MQQTVRVNLWPRLSRTRGAAVGLSGIAIVAVLCATLGGDMPHAVPALLLLVPVVLTSVLADRWVALAVAIAGSFVYALVFIPPIGELHVDLAEDAAVLAAFVLVAVTISAISGLRRPAAGADLIDEQRAVLLRGVSHDLRNPLSTIRSISTELLEGDVDHDLTTRHELLGRVRDESERLDRIVGNLLSVSRVQAGALIPTLEPESIAQLAQRSIGRLHTGGSHVVSLDVPADLPDVLVDAVQIDQVLTNLVENALRYTPAGSLIRVCARERGGRVEVAVRDDGPGFPAERRGAPFQPFQATSGASPGLGLAVCRAIVEAHGGTLLLRDEPSGGAAVSFDLPLYRDDGADPADRG